MFSLKKFFNLNYYTSELDEFLAEYTKMHPNMSASQRQEWDNYQLIAKGLRYGNDLDGRAKE